jgi:anti-sigma regulatory factor (Ser/Thr protein kinase)
MTATEYLEWADDGCTLVFNRLKTPEVLEVVERTRYLSRVFCGAITFDLSRITTAFSAQALPLVVVAQNLRSRGVEVSLTLPADPALATLFRNTNWAHLISPSSHEPGEFSGHHLSASTYVSPQEQTQIVNAVIDLLLEEGHIDRTVLGGFEWSLNEVTDNVLVHAGDVPGIVQVTRYRNTAHIVVCDAGRGIPQSMRDAFRHLDDVEAVRHAFEPGVTSGPGQGNGLAGIHSIAMMSRGEISVLSRRAYGRLQYSDDKPDVLWMPVAGEVDFPGSSITIQLPLDVHLDLRKALRFQSPDWEPWDYIESRYEEDEGAFRIVLSEERRGVGSRPAGRAIRNKVENLLSTDAACVVRIDFVGIRMVASSFADELVGKLRAELGEDQFHRRIRLVNIDESLRPVVSGAVSQRLRAANDS